MKHFICALFFLLPEISYSMVVEMGDIGPVLLLKGQVEDGDLQRIKTTIKEHGYPVSVLINSHGGDVVEAMKIGRFFNQTFLEISATGNCDSACFVLWAGGYKRTAYAPLGLHRPHFEKKYFAGLSVSEAEEKYKILISAVKSYLAEMHVPNSFIDTMMSADSGRLAHINAGQLAGKISEYSPAKREWILSKCGALTAEEEKDKDLLFKQKALRSLLAAKQKDEEMIAYLRAETRNGKHFSEGYESYLEEKSKRISLCELAAIRSAREDAGFTPVR